MMANRRENYKKTESVIHGSKEEQPNMIRINKNRNLRHHVQSCAEVLEREDTIVLESMGRAIVDCVNVAENLRRMFPDLHHAVEIGTVDVTDMYEPIASDTDLEPMEVNRKVSKLYVTLSRHMIIK